MVSTPNAPRPMPPRPRWPGDPFPPRPAPDPEPGPTGPKIGQAEGRKPGDDEIMEKLRAIAGQTMRRWPDRRDDE
jgi:hypothetical protein